jgi:hypothetical protein
MAFGIQLKNSSGTTFFDSTVIGGNFLGTFTATATNNASFTIPHASLISTIYTQIFMINDLPTDQEALAHTISVNSGTGVVTATAQGNSSQSQTTQVVIFGK